jgi:uncharacterized protein (TIGR03435 family)
MLRFLACLSLVAVLPIAGFGQTAETKPFEAADVHVSAKARQAFMQGPYIRGDHYEIRQATMLNLISEAYGKDGEDIWGGPTWLEMNRYDILAKGPAHSKEERNAALQALLADRFKLVVHIDTKPRPAFALTAGKHPLMKKAAEATDSGCKYAGETAEGAPAGPGHPPKFLVATCHNMTMKAFAEGMRDFPLADRYLNHLVVLDQTELAGAWDFTLKLSLPGQPGVTAGDLVTLPDAIEKQLGLKLEPTKTPLPVLMVDSVNDTPTANLPNIAQILNTAADPTEFEVAVIKPTAPDVKNMNFQILRGGKVDIQGVSLKFLIEQAWLINDDMLADAPKWLEEDRWDITAKAPAASLLSAEWQGLPIDLDTVLIMMRNLLKERFKLEAHMEDRPVSAYNLVALKPKLKTADPTSRTRFKEGPATAEDAKNDPRNKLPILGRFVTVQNMTLTQFGEQLPNIAGGYIHTPVLDKTGLPGSFDFTLIFSTAGAFRGAGGEGRGGNAPPPGAGEGAAEPSGAVSLFEAVEKQLGLKLEQQKRPVSVLVIDKVERKPTDN